jgi:hypothetical protein
MVGHTAERHWESPTLRRFGAFRDLTQDGRGEFEDCAGHSPEPDEEKEGGCS